MGEALEAAQSGFERLVEPYIGDSSGCLVGAQAKQFAVRYREGPCGFVFVNPDNADEALPVYQRCGDDRRGFEVFHAGGACVWRRRIIIDYAWLASLRYCANDPLS